MKKASVLIIGLIFSAITTFGQDYKTAIGVRGGFFSGFSLKHFISGTDAVEGVVALHYRGLLVSGMYQIHANAFDAPGLNWYYGGGAHIGTYAGYHGNPWFPNKGNYTVFGINGVVGLEYKIEEIPVTIGADLIPSFNFFGHTGFWPGAGLTIRYTLN